MGRAVARSDTYEISSSASRPWDEHDTSDYVDRIDLQHMPGGPSRQLTWAEIQKAIGSRALEHNGVIKVATAAGVATLKSLLTDSLTTDVIWSGADTTGPDWTISVGETLLRQHLHDRYGLNRQRGIGHSRDSPFILIFAGSQRGEEFGYDDGWNSDGTYRYTGEGQVGDQKFSDGNLAVRDHLNNGKNLRLFEVRGTSATYVGQFQVANPPFEITDAIDRDLNNRSIIQFRLSPIGDFYAPREPLLRPSPRPTHAFIALEANLVESYTAHLAGEPVERRRVEAELVKRYSDWLIQRGHSVGRNIITPPGESKPLYSDLYDHEAQELVEAKGSSSRESVRMALGQILDYSRRVDHRSKALLLPTEPRSDLIALLLQYDVSCIWQTTEGGFERIDS